MIIDSENWSRRLVSPRALKSEDNDCFFNQFFVDPVEARLRLNTMLPGHFFKIYFTVPERSMNASQLIKDLLFVRLGYFSELRSFPYTPTQRILCNDCSNRAQTRTFKICGLW
jgi:hypothetical protein